MLTLTQNLNYLLLLFLFFTSACQRTPPKSEQGYPVVLGDTYQHDVPVYIETIGNVYSLQTVQIRPQVGGIIIDAYVKQGQYVKKGDPLYQIDPRPYQAQLDRTNAILTKNQALLKLNQSTLARYEELVKKDFVSKLSFEQYEANLGAAQGQVHSDEADVALAELNLSWTKPVSPIDGKVSQFNIDVGNLVSANDPNALTDIRQITPADIRFSVNQPQFVEIQQALEKGLLKFEAILPQQVTKPREGTIYFIDNHIDLSTGTILMRGTVPNEDEFFWPGEFVRVRLKLKTIPQAILVPEEAIKMGQDGPYVFVYQPEDSTVLYRKVIKGPSIEHKVVIEEGVTFGEKVVVIGQINLRDKAKVVQTGSL